MTTADSCDSDNIWQFGIYGRFYINKHCTEKTNSKLVSYITVKDNLGTQKQGQIP